MDRASPAFVAFSIVLFMLAILALFAVDRDMAHEDRLIIQTEMSDADYLDRVSRIRSEYEIWTLTERVQHHEWNLRSTKFIFWLSMLVSITGISFAFWQFSQADTHQPTAGEADEVEIGTELAKIQFKTRSLATFVLLLSLAYLFLYVRFLYPLEYLSFSEAFDGRITGADAKIEEIETGRTEVQAPSN